MALDQHCSKNRDGEHKLVPNIVRRGGEKIVAGMRCTRCGQVSGDREPVGKGSGRSWR